MDEKKIEPPYEREGYEVLGKYDEPQDGDQMVLSRLEEMRSDLSKPRHSIHYFYFEDEPNAEAAAKELKKMGFNAATCELLETSNGLKWPVKAEQISVINEDVINALRGPLTEIAERHGGDYDGWEAQID
jgi:regulator of RNase E activity RraB